LLHQVLGQDKLRQLVQGNPDMVWLGKAHHSSCCGAEDHSVKDLDSRDARHPYTERSASLAASLGVREFDLDRGIS
jgi:hypothetical protein